MSSTAIEKHNVAIAPMDPMQMIQAAFQAAIDNKQGLEVVDRILEQQKWMIEHAEKEAFQAALRRIQDQLKMIDKRGENPDTHSRYVLAQDIDNQINSLLQGERMSLSFEPRVSDKPDEVLVVGVLSLGAYSKEYPLPMPADGKGAKGGGVMSRTHATGSAITYAKRYLKNMIFDLRFRERDDDGNAAAVGSPELDGLVENMEMAADLADLKEAYGKAFGLARTLEDEGRGMKKAVDVFEKLKRDFASRGSK